MSTDTRFTILTTLLLFLLTGIGALLAYVVKGAVRWTRVEDRLEDLVGDVKQLVDDKEKVHQAMYNAMREDRNATNQRLRWLEEHLWGRRVGQPE